MEYYPNKKLGNDAFGKNNVAIKLYGRRIHNDQTLYEYLIEFLLIFASEKNNEDGYKLRFHADSNGELAYFVRPRIGLKRFIFYDRAKKSDGNHADERAYQELIGLLLKRIECESKEDAVEFIETLQDLLHGYAAVIKNRHWCAQAMLPICPELLFCEEMPLKAKRKKLVWNPEIDEKSGRCEKLTEIDTSFDHTRHNFLARGGEVFYLHILQGLERQNDREKKEKLEKLLEHLLTANGTFFTRVSDMIQETWESEMNLNPKKLKNKMTLEFIPETGYINCADYTITELSNFLSNDIHPIKRIELLAKGVMFQIMRLLTTQNADYLEKEKEPWIIDMRSKNSGSAVKLLSAASYKQISEDFITAINKMISESNIPEVDQYKAMTDARKESHDVFKSKGKEMQCIIPSNGPMERFSLSEDIIEFLVLSILKPGEKLTLDTFLRELYDHYSLVIGPEEYKYCAATRKLDIEQTNCFNANLKAFQGFLKNTGFLRDLSDATSIVVNPYMEVELN